MQTRRRGWPPSSCTIFRLHRASPGIIDRALLHLFPTLRSHRFRGARTAESHSQVDAVVKYIHNQEKHHAKKTFREEYLEMLKKFEVEYDKKYLFEWIEDL